MSPAQALDQATHDLRYRRLLIPSAAYRLELAQLILELRNKPRNHQESPGRVASAQGPAVAPRGDFAATRQRRQFSGAQEPFSPTPGADNRVDADARGLTPLKAPDNRVANPLHVQTWPRR